MLNQQEVKTRLTEKFGDVQIEIFDDGAFLMTIRCTNKLYGDMVDYHIVQALDLNIAIHVYSKNRAKVSVWFTPYDERWVESKGAWQIIFPKYSRLATIGPIYDFEELAVPIDKAGFEYLQVQTATCYDVK